MTNIKKMDPELKAFFPGKESKERELLNMRALLKGMKTLVSGELFVVDTGVELNDNVKEDQLYLEPVSKAWHEDLSFSINDYKPGESIKLLLKNESNISIFIFPSVFLTKLHIQN